MTFGDFEQMRQAEIRAEAALASLARRGMSRHRGVCWSGLSPEPTPAASDAAIEARARSRHARLVAWRQDADGLFLAAIAECQAAAREAYQAADRARAGAARGEATAWRMAILDELRENAARLRQGARRARRDLGG